MKHDRDQSKVRIDFDASSSNNHGTKFRVKRGMWNEFHGTVERVF